MVIYIPLPADGIFHVLTVLLINLFKAEKHHVLNYKFPQF